MKRTGLPDYEQWRAVEVGRQVQVQVRVLPLSSPGQVTSVPASQVIVTTTTTGVRSGRVSVQL